MFAAALLTFLRRYDIICALLILARCARVWMAVTCVAFARVWLWRGRAN